jgi:energy-coupling factor transporter transmembrane protein EcfT
MKTQYVAEARWRSRLAPYVLVAGLLGFGFSLLWVSPLLTYLAMGLVSGALLSFFHIMKWRTGWEGFQFVAIAVTFVPLFVMMHAHSGMGQVCQYFGVFFSVYAGTIVALRRRILTWIQP